MTANKMGGICGTNGTKEKTYNILVRMTEERNILSTNLQR